MNESSRQERIIRTSVIGILVNLLIAAVKIMIGHWHRPLRSCRKVSIMQRMQDLRS